MQALAATAPDDPANLRQLGVAHHKVGNVLGNPNYPNLGDHAGALAEMQQSIAVFERASARYPDNAMFKRNLAVARSNTADILTALGRRDEAMARGAHGARDLRGAGARGPDQRRRQQRPGDRATTSRPRCSTPTAARARRWRRSSGRRRCRISSPPPIRATRGRGPRPRPTTPCAAGCWPKLGQRAAALASLDRAVDDQPRAERRAIPTTSSCASPSPSRLEARADSLLRLAAAAPGGAPPTAPPPPATSARPSPSSPRSNSRARSRAPTPRPWPVCARSWPACRPADRAAGSR